MAKLEELEEVDLSGNMLKTVPTTIMNCRRMHTLIAHSNSIEVFPEVMQLMEMKVRRRLWQRFRVSRRAACCVIAGWKAESVMLSSFPPVSSAWT